MRRLTLLRWVAAGLSVFALGSCGFSRYERGFAREVAAMDVPPRGVEGPWVGERESRKNGHRGPLWCIVSPDEGERGERDFRYRAGWGWLRFGDYTHRARLEPGRGGVRRLVGEMELPGGLGRYRVKGELTPVGFTAQYAAAADHGVMRLWRPQRDR